MGRNVLFGSMFLFLAMSQAAPARAVPLYPELVGVNIAGGEFAGNKIPGTIFKDYIYPDKRTIDYFIDNGMTAIRVPFRWERLQRSLDADLDPLELSRLDAVVTYATSRGASVILDPHNYGRYGGQKIGSPGTPDSRFGTFWGELSEHYKQNDDVIFGLMNEPHGIPAENWARSAQVAVDAIRGTGAANLILVPGTAFTGAHSWIRQNADALIQVTDPADNMAFEVHQYLDKDFSGTSDQCQSETIGTDKLRGFTDWLYETGSRGFLGEFAGGSNPTCLAALDAMLEHVTENAEVWLGWTYWAAGSWWAPSYPFSVQPTATGGNRPQMDILIKHASMTNVPEPASFGLLGIGLIGMGIIGYRRRRSVHGPEDRQQP